AARAPGLLPDAARPEADRFGTDAHGRTQRHHAHSQRAPRGPAAADRRRPRPPQYRLLGTWSGRPVDGRSTTRHSGAMSQTTTLDPDEIARFSAVADEWWDPRGKFSQLHRINPIRIGFIKEE